MLTETEKSDFVAKSKTQISEKESDKFQEFMKAKGVCRAQFLKELDAPSEFDEKTQKEEHEEEQGAITERYNRC